MVLVERCVLIGGIDEVYISDGQAGLCFDRILAEASGEVKLGFPYDSVP